MPDTISTELEQYKGVIHAINEGDVVSLEDLKALVAPKAKPIEPPSKIPVPAVITDAQRADLAALPDVFGSVVPTERRKLTADEATALVTEQALLKRVTKFVGERIDNIRLTVLNHFDAEVIESNKADEYERDKDGHFIVPGRVQSTAGAQQFSNEPRKGSSTLSPSKLQELLSHEDWLAVTRQERVLDENKFMLHLRKNPHLVSVVAAATETGVGSNTIQIRKPQ